MYLATELNRSDVRVRSSYLHGFHVCNGSSLAAVVLSTLNTASGVVSPGALADSIVILYSPAAEHRAATSTLRARRGMGNEIDGGEKDILRQLVNLVMVAKQENMFKVARSYCAQLPHKSPIIFVGIC